MHREPENAIPQIESITADSLFTGRSQTVRLTVQATDKDEDLLSYIWSASAGTFNDSTRVSVEWRAPNKAGAYIIRVTVSDEEADVMDSVGVVVSQRAPGADAGAVG